MSKQARIGALRTIVAFVLVPPTAAMAGLLTYVLMWLAGLLPQGVSIDSVDAALALGGGVAFLAILVSVFCALPAISWLSERRALTLHRILMLGAVLGNVPFVIIVFGVTVVHLLRGNFSVDIGRYWYGAGGAAVRVFLGLVVGMSAAACFWFVGINGNPAWSNDNEGLP